MKLSRVFKAEGVSRHVSFGPTDSNSAYAFRNTSRGFPTSQPINALSAEHAHYLAVQQWLDGGSIGPRPQLSDFTTNRRSLSQKAESLSTRLNSCLENLFKSGI